MSEKSPLAQRSCCPVACTLDLLGDRWTLLVVRDLALGRSRFKEFIASPEGIPTNILSERLRRLIDANIVEQEPVEPGSKHYKYVLTEKGRDLFPILKAIRDWGLRWDKSTRALLGPNRG